MALWGALWIEKGSLDGDHEHLLYNSSLKPVMFKTRKKARAWIETHFGYIKTRKDLRIFPHGWRMPIPVKITVTYVK